VNGLPAAGFFLAFAQNQIQSCHQQRTLVAMPDPESSVDAEPGVFITAKFESWLAAFNACDIDAALALMTPKVEWPRAFKGGFVRGPEAIRAYWTEQWSEINPYVEPLAFHPEDARHVLVEVHQVVRDLAGTLVADEHVGHRFTIEHGLIQRMEVICFSASIVRSLKPSDWDDLG
jgi:hypothetical protein